MKVSEAISRLKVGDEVWVKGEVAYINKSGVLPLCIKFAERTKVFVEADEISLTEPQGEKVEVSQEFADWVEKSMMWKHDGSWAAKEIASYGWGAFMHDPATEEELLPKKYPWVEAVQNNKEKHIKAIYDGYIVKPKRWVVKFDDYHSTYVDSLTITSEKSRHTISGKEKAHYFTDRAKAEAVATLVEGSVEEVAE